MAVNILTKTVISSAYLPLSLVASIGGHLIPVLIALLVLYVRHHSSSNCRPAVHTLALTNTLSPLDSNAAGKLIVFALLCVFLCPFLVRARGQLAPHSKAIRAHIREDCTGVQQLEMLKMWTPGILGLGMSSQAQ